jgi:hypothetical protein
VVCTVGSQRRERLLDLRVHVIDALVASGSHDPAGKRHDR